MADVHQIGVIEPLVRQQCDYSVFQCVGYGEVPLVACQTVSVRKS